MLNGVGHCRRRMRLGLGGPGMLLGYALLLFKFASQHKPVACSNGNCSVQPVWAARFGASTRDRSRSARVTYHPRSINGGVGRHTPPARSEIIVQKRVSVTTDDPQWLSRQGQFLHPIPSAGGGLSEIQVEIRSFHLGSGSCLARYWTSSWPSWSSKSSPSARYVLFTTSIMSTFISSSLKRESFGHGISLYIR